mgnify:FL=1
MPKSIIAEGKTTSEAIANGLKMLNTSKEKVNIKVLENHDKRSFFSILAPRIVKVEMTLKENEELESTRYKEKEIKVNKDELNLGKQKVDEFLSEFSKNFKDLTYKTELDLDNGFIRIIIDGEDSKALIGYRGEVLNSLQVILNSIANKDSKEKVRLTLNIGNYREKREKSLEELADKIAKTVLKTGKSVTLEPMMAYERKIIHNRLQSSNTVKTYSIGEEPHRRVVIAKK